MKKILALLLVVLVLTGCNSKEGKTDKLDLNKIEEKLAGIAYSVDDTNKNIDLIFKENITVNDEYLTDIYNVDLTNVEEYLISVPSLEDRAEMYAIVLAKNGKRDEVEKEINKFIKAYQEEWKNTNQKEMVNNVLTQSYGNYLIYIISNKSETVYSTITGK